MFCIQWALGVRGERRGAIAWKGLFLSSTLLLISCMQLRKKTTRTIQRTVVVVASGCQERRHFRWTCFRRYTWYQLCRSLCFDDNWVLVYALLCLCKEWKGLSRDAPTTFSYISGCTLQNQPISEAKTTHDSITSNQRTHKGLRHFMKWPSWFCSTYKVLSPVRIPKAAIDPVSSLLPNALHAMGAWCAWGAIAWKGWCLSSILLLMSCMQLRKKTNKRMRRTVAVVVSSCQERRHFRWTCYCRCFWYQLCRSVCFDENWMLV